MFHIFAGICCFLFIFKFLFIYCAGFSLLCSLCSSRSKWGLLSSCNTQAAHCSSFSCFGAQALGHVGSVVVTPGSAVVTPRLRSNDSWLSSSDSQLSSCDSRALQCDSWLSSCDSRLSSSDSQLSSSDSWAQ